MTAKTDDHGGGGLLTVIIIGACILIGFAILGFISWSSPKSSYGYSGAPAYGGGYTSPSLPRGSSSADIERYREFGSGCQAEADARSKLHGGTFNPQFTGSASSFSTCHVDGGFSESGAIRGLVGN